MAYVDDHIETLTKESGIGVAAADRLYGKTQEIRVASLASQYYLTSVFVKESGLVNILVSLSRRTHHPHVEVVRLEDKGLEPHRG